MDGIYNNELVVRIGPFSEWNWQKDNEQFDVQLKSNGDIDSLKIKVFIAKSIIGIPDMTRITIWNLSNETIKSINTAGKSVRVYAGQKYGQKELLYVGALRSVLTQRQGTDYVTTLMCEAAGDCVNRAFISKTWTSGVDLQKVIKEIVNMVPGVIYDPLNNEVKGKIGPSGFSILGTAQDALTKLGNQFGFSWFIDTGVFYAIMDGKPKRTAIRLDKAGGLRNVSPRLSGIMQIQSGVDIFSMYRQNIKTGHTIRVESEILPEYNGGYEVHTVEYDLCPKDENWDMRIYSFKFKGE